MIISEGMRGQADGKAGDDDEFQALRKEVLSLRKARKQQSDTESSLIQELQRRCNRIIELEVKLDDERERSNRLERARQEEDEALSGELRDIMANVGTFPPTDAATDGPDLDPGTTDGEPSLPKNASCSPSAASSAEPGGATATAAATADNGSSGKNRPGKGDGKEDAADAKAADGTRGPVRTVKEKAAAAAAAAAAGVGGPLGAASGLFAEWGLGRGQRDGSAAAAAAAAHVPPVLSPERRNGTGSGGSGSGGGGGGECRCRELGFDKSPPEVTAEGSGEGAAGGGSARGKGGSGPLRARVVELELQKAEAADMFKGKADRCIRLEVQVEQLKNVVQSLSHSSTSIETQRLGEGSRTSATAPGTLDFSPLLRGVPDVDPSVLLLLHRTPWAEGVAEGVRKEEACFEWQSLGSRGEWSSKGSSFPAELSSLPYLSSGPPPPPPTSPPPPPSTSTYASRTSSSLDRHASSQSSPRATPADSAPPGGGGTSLGGRASHRQFHGSEGAARDTRQQQQHQQQQQQAGKGSLREKIGGAVAAFGAAGGSGDGGWGGSSPDAQAVTDESVSCRFNLGSVGLPSDHWEWVGGWMIDSEAEASADPDGWVYGSTPSEIADIARGRSRPSSVSGDEHHPLERSAARSSSVLSLTALGGRGGGGGPGAGAGGGGAGGAGSREGLGRASSSLAVGAARNQGGVGATAAAATAAARGEGLLPHPATGQGGNGEEAAPARPSSSSVRVAVASGDRAHGGGAGGGGAGAGGGGSEGGGGLDRGATVGAGGTGGGGGGGGRAVLRRRRLARLRMVTSVDGARESTKKFLEMMRRLCSLEILVRKLSRQVVTLHRQVTGMEGQVAFLAPLQPKLRQACALGRMDRQRGDAFQKKLIEAENELKVLRRCIDTTTTTTAAAAATATTTAPRPALPTATASSHRDPAPQNFPGWVGGLAHRAAGGLGRRLPPPPVPAPGFADNTAAASAAAARSFDTGRGDSGAAV